MVKIGWIGSQLNTFHLGSPNVGRQRNMNESVKEITTVNFGGTFVMNEGQALIMLMVIAVTFTLALNIVVQGIIG